MAGASTPEEIMKRMERTRRELARISLREGAITRNLEAMREQASYLEIRQRDAGSMRAAIQDREADLVRVQVDKKRTQQRLDVDFRRLDALDLLDPGTDVA